MNSDGWREWYETELRESDVIETEHETLDEVFNSYRYAEMTQTDIEAEKRWNKLTNQDKDK